MMEKIEALKHELFMGGYEEISDFLDYSFDDEEDPDTTDYRIDMAINEMSDDELNKWFKKYNIQ